MRARSGKIITMPMVIFELRMVVGNPYVHIFGVGLPVLLAMLITWIAGSQMPDQTMMGMVATSVYLGMGALIPMAILLMGYAVSYAGELEKGIPERMMLFGMKNGASLCNRAIAELLFITASFAVFFLSGFIFTEIEPPVFTGLVSYVVCIFLLSLICLMLGHGIACLCRSFGRTYCIAMMIYFFFMILGGMMGIQFEDMPRWIQAAARLLPVMYLNRDFYQIWTGETYNYMPMIQSYLFLGAAAGILMFIACRRPAANRKNRQI